MRKFSTIIDSKGIKRLALNNKPYFMKGLLDQGYYQEGFLTPTTDANYVKDYNIEKDGGVYRHLLRVRNPEENYREEMLMEISYLKDTLLSELEAKYGDQYTNIRFFGSTSKKVQKKETCTTQLKLCRPI